MRETGEQNEAFKAEWADQQEDIVDRIFFLLITKPRASMFLSEVIAHGGGIHCEVEGVVLSVE